MVWFYLKVHNFYPPPPLVSNVIFLLHVRILQTDVPIYFSRLREITSCFSSFKCKCILSLLIVSPFWSSIGLMWKFFFQLKFKVYDVFQCAQLKICLCQINVFYAFHSNFIFDKREFKIFLELSRIITSKNWSFHVNIFAEAFFITSPPLHRPCRLGFNEFPFSIRGKGWIIAKISSSSLNSFYYRIHLIVRLKRVCLIITMFSPSH